VKVKNFREKEKIHKASTIVKGNEGKKKTSAPHFGVGGSRLHSTATPSEMDGKTRANSGGREKNEGVARGNPFDLGG